MGHHGSPVPSWCGRHFLVELAISSGEPCISSFAPRATGAVVSHLEDHTGLLDTEAGEKVPGSIPLQCTVEISASQVSYVGPYVSCLDFA